MLGSIQGDGGGYVDLEGDGSIRLALYPDRTQRFSIGAQVIDADASAPWWVYVTAWLGRVTHRPVARGPASVAP